MHVTVRDLMTLSPVIVRDDATLREALEKVLSESASELYVADVSGRFLGSVPDYVLLKEQLSGSDFGRPVTTLMSRGAVRVDPDVTFGELAAMFRDGRHRRLPVVEEGRIVGQIDRRDVMRLMCLLAELDGSGDVVETDANLRQTESPIRGPRFAERRTHSRETTIGH